MDVDAQIRRVTVNIKLISRMFLLLGIGVSAIASDSRAEEAVIAYAITEPGGSAQIPPQPAATAMYCSPSTA